MKYYHYLLTSVGVIANNSQVQASLKEKTKPNIIIIYTDDQRYDALGVNNNNEIKTPNLDKFSSKGVNFTNANVAFSLSSPSRAAMITGRYGSSNGVLTLDGDLNKGEKSVADYLKQDGYSTGVSGKWHLNQKPNELGFDYFCYFYANGDYYNRKIYEMGSEVTPSTHCDDYCVDKSIGFLRKNAENKEPFLLLHCTQLPHMDNKHTWNAKDKTKSIYNYIDMRCAESKDSDLENKPEYLKSVRNRTQAAKYGYPNKESIQKHTVDYYSVITEMDQFLGRLIDELESLKLLDNTYIFFMGDNGWMLGEHGFTSKVLPYESSTKVPFFVVGPEINKAVNTSFVSNIDITPTILDLAGIELPNHLHGRSIVPILTKETQSIRDEFIYEGVGSYGGNKPLLCVISDEYRYIVTYDSSDLDVITYEELYDILNDPFEMNNIAGLKSSAKIKKELYKKILNHKKDILHMKNE